MSSRTYQSVTPEQAQGLLDTANSYNSIVEGDLHSGKITAFNCSIEYQYDNPVLTLTVLSHPFFVSDSTVLDQIEAHSGFLKSNNG